MFENIELSVWELLVYFTTGLLALGLVALHLTIGHGDFQISELIKGIPSSLVFTIFTFGSFLIGLLLEPIANLAEKQVMGRIRAKLKCRTTDTEEEKYKGLRQLIEKEFLDDSIKNSGVVTYHLCKDFILQKNLPTPFMAFLSKFGFYRSVSFLFYCNAVFIPFFYGISLRSIACGALSLLLAIIFEKRSIDFYGHMAGVVYRNFLIQKKFHG